MDHPEFPGEPLPERPPPLWPQGNGSGPSAEPTPLPVGLPTAWSAQPVPRVPRPRRRPVRTTVATAAALAFLVVGVMAGARAWSQETRPPTPAERAAAAAAAVAARWQSWPAGRIFPTSLAYTTGLLAREDAQRIGIASGSGCQAALEGAAASLAQHDGCRAALRATYLDQLQGVVYTTGVLAFPGARQAAEFTHGLDKDQSPVGLRALGFPGTASARFDDAARQAATRDQDGPYVVLTVSGYADGRSAEATKEARPSVFAPATQLASAILTPLNAPVIVNCAARAWSC